MPVERFESPVDASPRPPAGGSRQRSAATPHQTADRIGRLPLLHRSATAGGKCSGQALEALLEALSRHPRLDEGLVDTLRQRGRFGVPSRRRAGLLGVSDGHHRESHLVNGHMRELAGDQKKILWRRRVGTGSRLLRPGTPDRADAKDGVIDTAPVSASLALTDGLAATESQRTPYCQRSPSKGSVALAANQLSG